MFAPAAESDFEDFVRSSEVDGRKAKGSEETIRSLKQRPKFIGNFSLFFSHFSAKTSAPLEIFLLLLELFNKQLKSVGEFTEPGSLKITKNCKSTLKVKNKTKKKQ